MKVIRIDENKVMPWKNGRGSTTEILIWPTGSNFSENDFLWRLSSAPLLEEGEFSQFPGYRRWLTLIEGTLVQLHIDHRVHLVRPSEVIKFSGDQSVHFTLPAGPARDLNLMVQAEVAAEVQILKGGTRQLPLLAGTHLIYAFEGDLHIQHEAHDQAEVKKFETLLLHIDAKQQSSLVIQSTSRYVHIQIGV